MRQKKKFGIVIAALVLLAATSVYFGGYLLSVFTPQTEKSFQWIVGSGAEASDLWVNSGNHGDTAVVGDYKFVMQKTDRFDKALGCKSSADCGGGADTGRKDANNCPIYSQTVPTYGKQCVHSTCRSTSGCMNECDGYLSSRNYGDSWNYWQDVQTGTTTQDCSSLAGAQDTQACGYNVKIYKSGALIQTIPELGAYTGDSSVYFDRPDISAQFNSANGYHYARCDYILNWITPKFPQNQIDLQVSAPKTQYFQGENASVDVIVINNGSEMSGNLNVKYEIPTGLLNPSTQLDTQFVTIKSGINKFTYNIQTKGATSKILITPSVEIFMPTSGMSGVNYGGSNGVSGTPVQTAKVPVGTAAEKTFEVAISVVSYEDYSNAVNQADLLNLSLQEKLAQIKLLSATLEDKGKQLNDLQLSLDNQTAAIAIITQKYNEQGILMNQLSLDYNEKIIMIKDLTQNIKDQGLYIIQLKDKEKAQAEIINNLDISIAEKIKIAEQLTSEWDNQKIIISNLNTTLQEKIILLAKYNTTTTQQKELIDAMKLSFEEEQALNAALGLKIEQSQSLTERLQSSLTQEQALSAQYKAQLDEYSKQLTALKGNIAEQAAYISSLKLKINEQADLMTKMNLTIQQDAELLKKLNLNNEDLTKLIAGLKLSNEQDKALVAQLTANLAEQQRLLDAIRAEKQKTSVPNWVYGIIIVLIIIIAIALKKRR